MHAESQKAREVLEKEQKELEHLKECKSDHDSESMPVKLTV